jgi:hypothetical protein
MEMDEMSLLFILFQFFLTKLVIKDFLSETARKLNTCIVRLEGAEFDSSVNGTGTGAQDGQFELEIPCPKAAIYGGKCSNDECRWECDDCGQLIVIRKPANVSYLILDKLFKRFLNEIHTNISMKYRNSCLNLKIVV